MGYDVFISYSHGADDLLSARVQDGLSRFAKPWWRRRALNVFRDKTGLSANPGLWTSISEALDDARYFLFLASPDAAASVWCGREVEQWRAKHGSEGLLVLLTDGEIRWDENTNDFDWGVTTALGPAFAGAFAEEPFHIDMRWARSEEQLDLTNGQFRDQIADLAAPVHGMAKDELASADVKQHRRALRQAFAAGVALVVLTIAAVATSIFALRAESHARAEQHKADISAVFAVKQEGIAKTQTKFAVKQQGIAQKQTKFAVKQQGIAQKQTKFAVKQEGIANDQRGIAQKQTKIAVKTAADLLVSNDNLTKRGLALRQSTLLAEARLAARRGEQLMTSGDQTYELGTLLTAEAVRHACASSAIDTNSTTENAATYPDDGCAQPFVAIDGSVTNSASLALANAGGRFVTTRLAGSASSNLMLWSSDSQRLATFSSANSSRPEVVQVWNRDGSPAASVTSSGGLTPDSALSGDGNVLAVTSAASHGTHAVSAWDLSSRTQIGGGAGRRPALSADGSSMAWLPLDGSKAVEVSVRGAAPRRIALHQAPVSVAMSADGTLVAALVYDDADNFSVIPIDAVSGRVGGAVDVKSFATPNGSFWYNPPRISAAETADPPALSFAATGPIVWVYNNELHVAVRVDVAASVPSARVVKTQRIGHTLASGLYGALQTSTPDGNTIVLFDGNSTPITYQVWRESATGWSTRGIGQLEVCASNNCSDLSISPDGSELAVASLSALQIIDVRSSAGSSSGDVPNHGAVAPGTSVVAGPAGQTALSWNASSLSLVDISSQSQRVLPIVPGPGEAIRAVGFDPSGEHYVAAISEGSGCPCRVLILDASTGAVVQGVTLGATPIERVPHELPVGVALNDASNVVAVTFDNRPHSSSPANQCAVATYSVASGQPLFAAMNRDLGVGDQTVSVPAFRPDTNDVALVATTGSTGAVGGVVMNSLSGAIEQTLGMQSGVVVIVDKKNFDNDGYALRFSANGGLLAWNTAGSVVIWNVDSASGPKVLTDVVVVAQSFFDPTALVVSNDGDIATAGTGVLANSGTEGNWVVLTGDVRARLLSPLGLGLRVDESQDVTKERIGLMSVAMPVDGQIVSVSLDVGGSRYFTDVYAASPSALLEELCASASRGLTLDEWETYFPGELYSPACGTGASGPSPWNIDASPPAVVGVPAAAAKPMPKRALATKLALEPGKRRPARARHSPGTRTTRKPAPPKLDVKAGTLHGPDG